MKRIFNIVSAGLVGSVLLAACSTPNVGGGDYAYEGSRTVQAVQFGTVESVRDVTIASGGSNIIGAIAGGVAGAALGHRMGEGNGNAVATVLGALAGGAVGEGVESAAGKSTGVEVTVRLDNGYVIAVTQGKDESFRVGDRVEVVGSNQSARVTRVGDRAGMRNPYPYASQPNPNTPPPYSAPQ
jgi:outer membrane lipoprotein SlyB